MLPLSLTCEVTITLPPPGSLSLAQESQEKFVIPDPDVFQRTFEVVSWPKPQTRPGRLWGGVPTLAEERMDDYACQLQEFHAIMAAMPGKLPVSGALDSWAAAGEEATAPSGGDLMAGIAAEAVRAAEARWLFPLRDDDGARSEEDVKVMEGGRAGGPCFGGESLHMEGRLHHPRRVPGHCVSL